MSIRPPGVAPEATDSEVATHSGTVDVARDDAPRGDSLPNGATLAGGRLRIIRKIGYGGTGVLYEAEDLERGGRLALKQLRHSGPDALYALKNEFRALRNVAHPNLVRLHELYAEDFVSFFTMEFIDGDNFDWWVRPDGTYCEERLKPAFAQLVDAVSAIHEAGKLHRDLKPSNVLVMRDGHVVVLDFGLVADSERGGVGQTLPDAGLSGTPAYMAPELVLGSPPNAACDLYALGVILFEALTGKLPFEGSGYSMLLSKQARAAELPADLSDDIPAELRAVCLQLLSREPTERPSLAALQRDFASAGPTARISENPSASGLIGRSGELRELIDAYQVAAAGRLSVVMLAGESGIGKSALCEHFLKRMQNEANALVLAGRCYERESLPYKAIDPLIDELSRCLRRMPAESAAALLPRDGAALVQLFPVLARVHAFADAPLRAMPDPRVLQRTAFAALVELLGRLRDRGPVIVYVDDLQWTDADSVAFFRYLFVDGGSPPLLFLGSHRGDNTHCQLLASIMDAARTNRACQVASFCLGPLTLEDAERLALRMLGGGGEQAQDGLARSVARESQGNPFFVGELARFAASAAVTKPDRLSLTSLLGARFEPLSERARRLLEVLALTGVPLPVDVALVAAGAELRDLDTLCEARWARVSATQSMRCVECFHDRIRETVSAQLSEASCRALYAALAGALRASARSDPELLFRVLEGAGDRSAAAQQAVLAAEQAANGLAFEHAAELYRRALELDSSRPDEVLALTAKLGLALENAGHGLRAAAVYEHAAELSSGDLSLDYRRRAAEQLLATGHIAQGSALLRSVCEELRMAFPLSGHAALLATVRTRLLLRVRRGELARDPVRAPTAREAMQLRTARSAVTGLVGCLPLQASALAGQYLLRCLRSGDVAHRMRAIGFNAFLMSMIDPTDPAVAGYLARIEALAARNGDPELAGFSSLIHGTCAYHWNRFRIARQHLAHCLHGLRSCIGVEWEVDAAHVYDQLSALHAGEHADTARTTPSLIEDAFRRQRRWAGSMLSGYAGMPAWILADDVEGYRRMLDTARRQWEKHAQQQWPDYVLTIGEAFLAVYAGVPRHACTLLDAERKKRAGALFKISGNSARWFEAHHGRCAAAALSESPCSDARSVAVALEGCRASLARHPEATWKAFAALFEGALEAHAGRRDRSLSALQRSLDSFEADGLAMHAAAARRRLGQMLGGTRGRELLAAGDDFMRVQSVKNLEAMTELHCPGYRSIAG